MKRDFIEAVKEFFNDKNLIKIVRITNIVLFLSSGPSLLSEVPFKYFVLAVYMAWFVFNILFFGLKKRYIECILFVILMAVYLYAVFNFSAFVK